MGDVGGLGAGSTAQEDPTGASIVRLVQAALHADSVELVRSTSDPSDQALRHVHDAPSHSTRTKKTTQSGAPSGTPRTLELVDGSVLTIHGFGPSADDEVTLAACADVANRLIEREHEAGQAAARLRAGASAVLTITDQLRVVGVDHSGDDPVDERLVPGADLTTLFDERDRPELERRVHLARTPTDTDDIFTIGTLFRGTETFADLTFVPLRDIAGTLTGFGVGVLNRTREIGLIQRSDRHRRLSTQLIAGAPLGVVVFNEQRRVVHSNAIAEHLLGLADERVTDARSIDGRSIDELEVGRGVAEELHLTFDTGEPGAFAWNEGTIAMSCAVAPVFDVARLSHVIWYLDPLARSLDAKTSDDLDLEMSIREAVEDQTIGLRFHPEFDATTGELTAIEALALAHTHNRVMTGEQFIPAAEAAGIVDAVDATVLERAIAQTTTWVREGWLNALVRINVSTATLHDPHFVERLAGHLSAHDLPGRHICLEITETGIISDPVATEAAISAVQGLGVTIALDDFGTGHSSLGRLARFSVDVVKLDQSFAEQVHLNEQTRIVVDAIVGLAHRLGAIVVAEGVQNERQRAALTGLGCDRLQGHFLSRPLASEHIDIARFLANPLPAIVGGLGEALDLRD